AAREPPGQTLPPTALAQGASLRLVGDPEGADWDTRGLFCAACAEAMRRILVDNARRKGAVKRGGGRRRVPLAELHRITEFPEDLLDLDDALTRLAAEEPDKARLGQLAFFAGRAPPGAAAPPGVPR